MTSTTLPTDVRSLARHVLDVQNEDSIPSYLLQDLSALLAVRPDDVLFKIIPEPGKGYGSVKCLEKACLSKDKVIALTEHADFPDGGMSFGVGSLDYFTHHQRESPAHKKSRRERLAATGKSTTLPPPSKSSSNAKTGLQRTSTSTSNSQSDIKPAVTSGKANPSSSTKNNNAKRCVIEIVSDDDDEIKVVKTSQPKKPTISTVSASSSQDKGKGKSEAREPLGKHASTASVDANSMQDSSQSARKRLRLSDIGYSDEEVEAAGSGLGDSNGMSVDARLKHRSDRNRMDQDDDWLQRNERSSADSDLMELSDVFGRSTQAHNRNATSKNPLSSTMVTNENMDDSATFIKKEDKGKGKERDSALPVVDWSVDRGLAGPGKPFPTTSASQSRDVKPFSKAPITSDRNRTISNSSTGSNGSALSSKSNDVKPKLSQSQTNAFGIDVTRFRDGSSITTSVRNPLASSSSSPALGNGRDVKNTLQHPDDSGFSSSSPAKPSFAIPVRAPLASSNLGRLSSQTGLTANSTPSTSRLAASSSLPDIKPVVSKAPQIKALKALIKQYEEKFQRAVKLFRKISPSKRGERNMYRREMNAHHADIQRLRRDLTAMESPTTATASLKSIASSVPTSSASSAASADSSKDADAQYQDALMTNWQNRQTELERAKLDASRKLATMQHLILSAPKGLRQNYEVQLKAKQEALRIAEVAIRLHSDNNPLTVAKRKKEAEARAAQEEQQRLVFEAAKKKREEQAIEANAKAAATTHAQAVASYLVRVQLANPAGRRTPPTVAEIIAKGTSMNFKVDWPKVDWAAINKGMATLLNITPAPAAQPVAGPSSSPARGLPAYYTAPPDAYGDDVARMNYLAGRGPANFGWGTGTASSSRHTANLGPMARGMAALVDSDDDDMPDWDRAAGALLGTDIRGLRMPDQLEGEEHNYFAEATVGFDFNEEGNAALEEGLATIGLKEKGDIFPNSQIKPYPHQILGIAWMLNQEKVKTKMKGGILADEMGLGKTVQTISLIMLNRAKPDDDEKTTLVLAPVALLGQWKNEIEKLTDRNMSVYIYHGPGKNIKKRELKKYDVVLTTQSTMANEWLECDEIALARVKAAAKKRKDIWNDDDTADWHDKVAEQPKPLFKINWRRVVIDEAQNIRNRNTKASRAICFLSAQYRWCLTGTPITNTLTDIYSLMRFLKISPWHEYSHWSARIGRVEKKRPDVASARVQALLKNCLLRRNKDSTLNGVRLIELLPKHVNEHAVFLTPDEQTVYDYLEGKAQQQVNKYIKAGTVMKNYAHVLTMLLRLRQCVGHPALVMENCIEAAHTSAEDRKLERDEAHESAIKAVGKEKVEAILKRRIDLAKQRFEDEQAGRDVNLEECPICMETLDASALITACGHAFCPCITEWMESPETAANNPEGFKDNERTCPNCRQKVTKDTLYEMKHFEPTREQIAEITGTEPDDDQENFELEMLEFLKNKNIANIGKTKKRAARKAAKSPKPRSAKARAARKGVIKDSEDEDELQNGNDDDDDDFIDDSEESRPVAGYSKKTGGQSDSEADDDEDSIESSDDESTEGEDSAKDDDEANVHDKKKKKEALLGAPSAAVRQKYSKGGAERQFITSSKLDAMVDIIRAAPKDDKIMIISQWTTMLDLVSSYLYELNIKHLAFRGDMNRRDRDDAVQGFNNNKSIKCMLMSLKAGGVGLNLTGGNRAILLDLAWSPAVEAQCFDRLHRLGQKKEVFVERCIVAGTVEDRILTLQDHKKKLADNSLGEGTGQKLKKMGVAEIKMLFGLTAEGGKLAAGWTLPDKPKPLRAKQVPNADSEPAGPAGV